MRFCLHPGRSTRPDCRLYRSIFRHGASRQYHSYHVDTPSSSERSGALCLARQLFLRKRSEITVPSSSPLRYFFISPRRAQKPLEFEGHIQLPRSQRNEPESWIPYLEAFLPSHLRANRAANEDSERTEHNLGRVQDDGLIIASLLRAARQLGNLDLLAHLGYKLGRWSAVEALVTKLLDAADAQDPGVGSKPEVPSNLAWGSQAWQLLTNDPSDDSPDSPLKPALRSPRSIKLTLDEATSDERVQRSTDRRRIMSEVWQSLGSFILGAAELPKPESNVPMSITFGVLARLHHSEFIPDAVYQFSTSADTDASFRPPGMYMLSAYIMDVLSDAAWMAHQASVSEKAATIGEHSPFVQYKMALRELGPAVWLEFILWCCVEGAYIKEGVWILARMKARSSQITWDIKSWKSLLDDPDALRNTNIGTEDFWQSSDHGADLKPQSKKSEAFYGMGRWTLSKEIIDSFSEGLMDVVSQGAVDQSCSLPIALQHLDFLDSLIRKSLVREPEVTSKIAYRQSIRLIENDAVDNDTDPLSLEKALKAYTKVIPSWDDSTPNSEEDLDRISKHDIYMTSLCLIGLMEYNLRSLCLHRQAGRAVNTLSRLQTLVDESKLQHMRSFLDTDLSPEVAELPADRLSSRSICLSSSSIPQLSPVTLASLVDLLTATRAFSLVEWLLFSLDADGPLIPPSLYGDQVLAPSIIRFATASRNMELCEKVVQSLPPRVPRNTLKALLNFRITMGEWETVEATLKYLQEYKHKSWGDSNVTALAAAVLRLNHSIMNSTQPVHPHKELGLAKAKVLLRRLLNGEFDSDPAIPVRSVYQERALYRMYLLLSSLPGVLQEVCQTVSTRYNHSSSQDVLPYIPSVSFHNILSAVVDIQGSEAGKRLWEQWCIDPAPTYKQNTKERDIFSLSRRISPGSEADFDSIDEPGVYPISSSAADNPLQGRAVFPNLNTVRIIAQAAVKEYRQQQTAKLSSGSAKRIPDGPEPSDVETDVPAESVLDFCIERFRRLGLDDKEIDREVQGRLARLLKQKKQRRPYLPAERNSPSSSPDTPCPPSFTSSVHL